jgi:hypothetical protein
MGTGTVMQEHDNRKFNLTFVLYLVAAFEMSDSNSSHWLCHYAIPSGFGGLEVSMLASGSRVRGF